MYVPYSGLFSWSTYKSRNFPPTNIGMRVHISKRIAIDRGYDEETCATALFRYLHAVDSHFDL